MKRMTIVCIAAVALTGIVPVAADDHGDEKKFMIDGGVRVRFENVENFTVFNPDSETRGDFWPYRVDIGARGQLADNVVGYVGLLGFGNLGGDGTPYDSGVGVISQSTPVNTNDVRVREGWIHLDQIFGGNGMLRAGRQAYEIGNELLVGDLDFYNGTSYDGARVGWAYDGWAVNGFYFNIAERSQFLNNEVIDDEDSSLAGADAEFFLGDGDAHAVRPYVIHYREGGSDIGILTFGAQYGRAVRSAEEAEDGMFDWNAEFAVQSGDLYTNEPLPGGLAGLNPPDGEFSAGGYIFEGWFGVNFAHGDESWSRVHLGVFQTSGAENNDLTDGDWNAFIPLFGDFHANNRLGDLDLFGLTAMPGFVAANFGQANAAGLNAASSVRGVTDINLGYTYTGGMHDFMVALHQLAFTEDGGGDDEIGLEVDLRYGYDYTDNVRFEAGVAQLLAGDVLDGLAGGSSEDPFRLWAQLELTF